MKQIVIDTDGVYDDLLALYLLFGYQNVDILGISLVGGTVNLAKCFANISYLIKLLKSKQKINIIPGFSQPNGADWQTCEDVMGPSGLGFDLIIPPIKTSENLNKLIRFYRSIKNPFTLLCLGPLTNIAAIIKYPDIRKKIKNIISMGGNINIKGNTFRNVEFNYNADPVALIEVLRSKLPVTIVPLDVTRRTYFSAGKLIPKINIKKKAGLFLSKLLEFYIADTRNIKTNAFHDPVAAAITINPSIGRYKKLQLDVDRYGKLTLGRKKNSIQVSVCMNINEKRLFNLYRNAAKNLKLL